MLTTIIDTTQIDQPDTPAPVFAARAFKTALFGTPARDQPESRSTRPSLLAQSNDKMDQGSKTPPRPQGILLTPGTGTSRRKRVSFGRDVKKTNEAAITEAGRRTRLTEALEKARQKGAKPSSHRKEEISDDDWEEEDEEGDFCSHDITVDLNEPHSQSGKYWKEEFEKYHEDAKAEMEKLLKYKQLAKSYAKQKDAEANELAERLKQEQRKVISMEKNIADGASQIVAKHGHLSEEASPELISKLSKQTALASQYRLRVQELEDQLEDFLRDREEDTDVNARRRRQVASPRVQKTLAETQRELRRARNQVKELEQLRSENTALRSQLRDAEQRAASFESQGKADDEASRDGTRIQELRAQLREAREGSRRKDDELRKIKREFESFKKETQAREEDTKAVLERAHNKISELKKEIRTLKTHDSEPALRSRSLQQDLDGLPQEESEPQAVATAARSNLRGISRRSFDLADLGGDDSLNLNDAPRPRTFREKFAEDVPLKATQPEVSRARVTSNILVDRPNVDKPRWQPFVPRSPRNRAYLGEDLTRRIQNGSASSATLEPKDIAAPDLPTLAKPVSRLGKTTSWDKGDAKVDLLQDRFERLGGPDRNNAVVSSNTAKSNLPPERRAAAIARIERRMAEKKRMRQRGFDKENMRP